MALHFKDQAAFDAWMKSVQGRIETEAQHHAAVSAEVAKAAQATFPSLPLRSREHSAVKQRNNETEKVTSSPPALTPAKFDWRDWSLILFFILFVLFLIDVLRS